MEEQFDLYVFDEEEEIVGGMQEQVRKEENRAGMTFVDLSKNSDSERKVGMRLVQGGASTKEKEQWESGN